MLRDMSQLSILGFQNTIWSPVELNRYIRQLIESDYRMGDLWLAGEVSNLSHPSSGHLYFSIRDAEAAVRCVMWKQDVARLPRPLQVGEAIETHGNISVYEAGGQYQLYVDQVRFAGEGELYQEYLLLKERLETEGLFAAERKRALPRWPRRIGIVTSPTGAALRDVLNVLRRRYPLVEAMVSPTPVQGEAAPDRIVKAIQAVNEESEPDVVLLVRGGGSVEDLWAFNDERVVRAVAASKAPLVTGIGHETDVMLADFAADLRAPTPSAAAEVATPDSEELKIEVREMQIGLSRAWSDYQRRLRTALQVQRTALERVSPRARVDSARQRVDELLHRATSAIRHEISLQKAAVGGLNHTLQAVGPDTVLARGYAIVRNSVDGSIVRSVKQVSTGDELQVRVSDGEFGAQASSLGNS
ncbi:MAG: exodeoxyribonuclease VII large subunit [Anaerolineae bacterium]|nr:MAG: exodeoxyribonuclease VII large subunit [Anaerolineae bacterium]